MDKQTPFITVKHNFTDFSYSLAELIAQCDLSALPPGDMKEWELMNAIGKETQLSEGCMNVFFDTEFTELGIDPRLISIGLVSEGRSREFYAELSDTYQPSDCSDFVREAVLPHLEGGEARMTLNECAHRLIQWLMAFGEPVQLATDSLAWDWPWIEELFAEAGTGTNWPAHITTHDKATVFRPWNVEGRPLILPQSPAFNLAVEDAYVTGLRRHHALDDAKANRIGWLALSKDKGPIPVERFSV